SLAEVPTCEGLRLLVRLSKESITGLVVFSQEEPAGPITVSVDLKSHRDREAKEFDWKIYEVPVDYSLRDPCGELPEKVYVDLTAALGKLRIPSGNKEFTVRADEIPGFTVLGREGTIWGRSVVVSGNGVRRSCATIEVLASFRVALGVGASTEDCRFLQFLFDPDGKGLHCAGDDPSHCAQGHLSGRLGPVHVGAGEARESRQQFFDPVLVPPEDDGPRRLYLVLEDEGHPGTFHACAHVRRVPEKAAQAVISAQGVKGTVTLLQENPFVLTKITMDMKGLRGIAGGYHIHEFPVPGVGPDYLTSSPCRETGGHYNPFRVDVSQSPPTGRGSHDAYELGDLSGKHGILEGLDDVKGTAFDTMLPLWGPFSSVGRSIVVHRLSGERWVCGTIFSRRETVRAVAVFRFPVVGIMEFRQEVDDPLSDTSIFLSDLLYSDGSDATTDGHRWYVNVNPPVQKNALNWTDRCSSAGALFNPSKVFDVQCVQCSIHRHGFLPSGRVSSGVSSIFVKTTNSSSEDCSLAFPEKCELGDLTTRHGSLKAVGLKSDRIQSRRFFTDSFLPLSGPNSVIGRSIVIHDDKAPEHRGDRMACTTILKSFRHKGVANEWYTNSRGEDIEGELEITQDSPNDPTRVEVELRGLKELASGYHVHMVSVPISVEFPCQGSEVYDHFNPLAVQVNASLPWAAGTADQYEIGDLSGKHGGLDAMKEVEAEYNDTMLPLYGLYSVVGRSVVVHKQEDGARWGCSSIRWGYATSEARQYSSIASFHHPQGFLYGYIRFRQVVYTDGSSTDTSIEVNLRYPGSYDKNQEPNELGFRTTGHGWAVHSSGVGQDAVVKASNARCVAAGEQWNPYFVHSYHPNKDEFYKEECGPEVPLRCKAGDLTGKLGTISIGGKRAVFGDANLPFGGEVSALGKSVVIFDANSSGQRLSCAVIEPDDDIVKWTTIEKSPRFVAAQMMDELREVLGAPEWMVELDAPKTKELHDGACLQILIHFKGPKARELELDFSRLLGGGVLSAPTISLPGVDYSKRPKKLSHQQCNYGESMCAAKSLHPKVRSYKSPNPNPLAYRFTLGTSGDTVAELPLFCFEGVSGDDRPQKDLTGVFGLGYKRLDAAAHLMMRVLMAVKSNQVEEAVSSLSKDQVDLLMKYIYRGFEIPSEGSSGHLLLWHEKAFEKGGIGSIVLVLCMATIASTQSAKKLFEDNKIRLSERVQANVLLLGSLTRQVQRGSKSSESVEKLYALATHLGFQFEAIENSAEKLENGREREHMRTDSSIFKSLVKPGKIWHTMISMLHHDLIFDSTPSFLPVGYDVVAINTYLDASYVAPKKKREKEEMKEVPLPPDLKEVILPSDLEKFKRRHRNPRIYQRITVELPDPVASHKLMRSPNLKRYDILAVLPQSPAAFLHACNVMDIDIITIDPTSKYPVRLNRRLYNIAVKRGVSFELLYSPMLRDVAARKNMISIGHDYFTLGNAKLRTVIAYQLNNYFSSLMPQNIIISSGAERSMDMRTPFDAANIGLLFGLKESQAKDAITKACRAVIMHSETRKTVKGVASVIPLSDFPESELWKLDGLLESEEPDKDRPITQKVEEMQDSEEEMEHVEDISPSEEEAQTHSTQCHNGGAKEEEPKAKKPRGHHLELGASWIHGVLGNPMFELALSNKLVDINYQPKPHHLVALTEQGTRVPFHIVQEVYDAYSIFFRRCEEYFLSKYEPPEGIYSVGDHVNLEVSIYLQDFSPEEQHMRRMLFNHLLNRETCISGCNSMDDIDLYEIGSYTELPGGNLLLKNGYSSILPVLLKPIPEHVILKKHVVQHIRWRLTWNEEECCLDSREGEHVSDSESETESEESGATIVGRTSQEQSLDTVTLEESLSSVKASLASELIKKPGSTSDPHLGGRVKCKRSDGIPVVELQCENGATFYAEHVICTLPLGVLKESYNTMFDPPLPKYKVDSIQRLLFGTVNKIYLIYDRSFLHPSLSEIIILWEDEQKQEPIEQCWFKKIYSFTKMSDGVLLAWLSGEAAEYAEHLDSDVIADQCTDILRKFLKDPYVPKPIHCIRTSWKQQPGSRGSYTSIPVGSRQIDMESLSQPIYASPFHEKPVLLFAGEHTHPTFYSTVHGAYLSGRDAGLAVGVKSTPTPSRPWSPQSHTTLEVSKGDTGPLALLVNQLSNNEDMHRLHMTKFGQTKSNHMIQLPANTEELLWIGCQIVAISSTSLPTAQRRQFTMRADLPVSNSMQCHSRIEDRIHNLFQAMRIQLRWG
ncbi:unnamed protein product, partial [Darwinula stevensoni]